MATLPIVFPKDRKFGIAATGVTLLALFIYLYFTTILMADPAPADIPPVVTETTIEQIELKNLVVETGGGGSAGSPSDDPLDKPKPQTEKVLVKNKPSSTHHTSGQSTNNTSPNSNNTSSSVKPSNDPFGSGGINGKDGHSSSGKFGQGEGPEGTGPETGGGSTGRTRLNNVSIDHIESDRDETIYLKLTVDANGNVVSAISTSKTTTTDARIINQVKAAVISQVKFSKSPGSAPVQMFYTVKLDGK